MSHDAPGLCTSLPESMWQADFGLFMKPSRNVVCSSSSRTPFSLTLTLPCPVLSTSQHIVYQNVPEYFYFIMCLDFFFSLTCQVYELGNYFSLTFAVKPSPGEFLLNVAVYNVTTRDAAKVTECVSCKVCWVFCCT